MKYQLDKVVSIRKPTGSNVGELIHGKVQRQMKQNFKAYVNKLYKAAQTSFDPPECPLLVMFMGNI